MVVGPVLRTRLDAASQAVPASPRSLAEAFREVAAGRWRNVPEPAALVLSRCNYNDESVSHAHASIGRRLFNVVDDDVVDRRARRLQLETQLLLQR